MHGRVDHQVQLPHKLRKRSREKQPSRAMAHLVPRPGDGVVKHITHHAREEGKVHAGRRARHLVHGLGEIAHFGAQLKDPEVPFAIVAAVIHDKDQVPLLEVLAHVIGVEAKVREGDAQEDQGRGGKGDPDEPGLGRVPGPGPGEPVDGGEEAPGEGEEGAEEGHVGEVAEQGADVSEVVACLGEVHDPAHLGEGGEVLGRGVLAVEEDASQAGAVA